MLFEIQSTCKGGGYRYCRTKPMHPKANSNGLYPLHRVLVENELGRILDEDEVVHHVDGDKSNDDVGNLKVMSRAEHSRVHASTEKLSITCPVCGGEFSVKPHVYRLRMERSKSGRLYCSRSCGTKAQRRRRSEN